jgi:predicted transcriptional regulator
MSTALKQILSKVATWPTEDQDALAEAAREIEAARTGIYVLSADEAAAVSEGLAEADRGEFAPDEDIAALFERHAAT